MESQIDSLKDNNKLLHTPEDDLEWVLQEGTMAPGFLNLEKKISQTPGIESVIVGDSKFTSTEDILMAITSFYQELYANHDTHDAQSIHTFLENLDLPQVLQDTTALGGLITEKEIETAIGQLCLGKSPGCDGLTAEFYKSFDQKLLSILCQVFNDVWEKKNLTLTQKIAIIIVLFKKGDTKRLNNYRPISLTNADYKILAYILMNCLSPHLSDVISVNQTAYMHGHFIGTNIRSVQDTMAHFAKHSLVSLILFLDFKAFDSVPHQFLFILLEKIGLPLDFISWVKIMYTDVSSSVCHNNWLSPSIMLEHGVCQGCPLSCHLFNLSSQVLIFHLWNKGLFKWWFKNGDPCSLYADDTAIFVQNPQQLSLIIDGILLVGTYSGLELNLSKTIAYQVGVKPHMVLGVEVASKPVKYLGAFLDITDVSKINFKEPLTGVRNNIHKWNKR